MDYDVVGIGDNDLIEGPQVWSDLVASSTLPMVSANVRSATPGWESLHLPYRIIRKGKFRIGVIGLSSPESFQFVSAAQLQDVTVDSPFVVLARILPLVRKKADLVVVLSHGGTVWDRRLARQFPDIDVIVGSHAQDILPAPLKDGRTIIVKPGPNGSYVGQLNLELDKDKRIRSFSGSLIPLKSSLIDDPDIKQGLDRYFGSLGPDVPRQGPTTADLQVFRGAETCKPCHEAQYQQWQTTPHARAFATLVHENKSEQPDCLRCHTTGFGYATGFRTLDTTVHLANVQCEACHQLTADHDQPTRQAAVAPISVTLCATCHTPSQSLEFHYEEAIEHVKH